MHKETKVKYTKDSVIITMDKDRYTNLCKGFNSLHHSMNSFSEMLDFSMSEVRDMDNLRWTMRFALGFVEPENYHSDFTIPKE
jgi:hypothetical protein